MEKMEASDNKIIKFGSQTYELVERHRPDDSNDSRVYKGDDSFMRIGPDKTIDANLLAHRRLEDAGFPVPHILQIGTMGNEKFFIEESFGDKTFRLQFAEEIENRGELSTESFEGFLQVIRQYLNAQAKSPVKRDLGEFIEGAHVDQLCEELPEFASQIRLKANQHLESLTQFPFVLSQGDLSPNNLFPKGVIDLEDALSAPFGYDAVCALTTTDWYPSYVGFEFIVTPYHFSQTQKEQYLAMCDEISEEYGFPKISTYLNDFKFFRAAWLTEGMGEWPKTQKYRHERFINEFLK